MSPANVLNLQQEGIAAARAGNKSTAHRLLLKASKLDPKNKSVWLWLAVVAPSAAASVSYLREAQTLSPKNAQILAALQQAEKRLEREQTAVWHCPICETAASTAQEICPACQSVVSLSNHEALFNNPSPNSDKLLAAMTRLQERLEAQPSDVATRYKLALAHLNLGETAGGLEQLRAALTQQPDNSLIKTAVLTVEAHLPEQPAPETAPAEKAPIAPAWILSLIHI